MAVSVITSLQQISDSNGDPVSGATVTVYDAGTTTPKSLFSDAGLSVAAANPIVCDAFGRHDMMYFTAGTYKIVVKTSGGSTLYTRDNIDPSVPLGSGALAIANGGTGATTAGGARTNLGVPSQSEVDDIASDVAALQSAINAISGVAQGRLTLSTGTPVMTTDVTSTSTVYYTPYIGAQIPIWNGSAFVLTTFSELSLSLVTNHLANTIYDCFIVNDNGTVRLVTGPAWNTSTSGSGARGSGAGTTEITRQSGILVNSNAMTARYGSTTLSVSAKLGTFVGSILIDGSAGQVTCHASYGQSRNFGLSNAYNRVSAILSAGDPTASWSYTTATIRASNNTSTNSIKILQCLASDPISCRFQQRGSTATNSGSGFTIGIGLNSTTAFSGTQGQFVSSGQVLGVNLSLDAYYNLAPSLGLQTFTSLEKGSGTATDTFFGTEADMRLTTEWRY